MVIVDIFKRIYSHAQHKVWMNELIKHIHHFGCWKDNVTFSMPLYFERLCSTPTHKIIIIIIIINNNNNNNNNLV